MDTTYLTPSQSSWRDQKRHQPLADHGRTARSLTFSRVAIAMGLSLPCMALATESEAIYAPVQQAVPPKTFGSGFFQGGSRPEQLAFLLAGNSVLPGTYRVDIYINGDLSSRRDIDFEPSAEGDQVQPCLNLSILQELGIDLTKLPGNPRLEHAQNNRCINLTQLISEASTSLDTGLMRLKISVPQAFMQAGIQGYIDPTLWDHGVNAAFSNYQLSVRRSKNANTYDTATYLGLQNGLNFGAWRLRNESGLTASSGQSTEFNSNRTFIEHDVTPLKAQFALGELYSRDSLFDSVRFRGIQLHSDDAMLADSERGYGPVIRGVAETNATVEVYQNGYLLYSTPVTPGPFTLTDVYPSGSNGDLEIIVIESDGRRRITQQAFGNLPVMLRQGRLTFSASAGQFQSLYDAMSSPSFISSALAYGLTDNLTGMLGVQASDDYQALSLGMGRNTFIGAVSVDITQSSSRARQQTSKGQSVRLLYSKTFVNTDTNFMLAAYRYSTEGYRTLNDHVQAVSHDPAQDVQSRSRARLDMTLQQNLGSQRRYGSTYLTASDQRYWNNADRSQSITTGYSNNWQQLTYDIGLTRTLNTGRGNSYNGDSQFTLSLSMPLGREALAPRLYVRNTRDRNKHQATQAGLSGSLGKLSQYSIQAGNDSTGGSSGFASLGGDTRVGRYDVGYGQGRDYKSLNLGASGSVVAHAGGINWGHQVGESFALVEVPHTQGVGITNHSGVQTGSNGFAIVPNLQPYRLNWISLDVSNLGADIELQNAVQQLVPRRGAVIHSSYQTQQGRRVQFHLYRVDGSSMGFGASVEDAQGKRLAVSDPYGKALTLLDEDQGVLRLNWESQSCTATYRLPARNKALNYEDANLICNEPDA